MPKTLKFTLGETLTRLDITRNKLAVESKVRPPTIADLVNGDSKRIEVTTLIDILEALDRVAAAKGMPGVGIEDIIAYE